MVFKNNIESGQAGEQAALDFLKKSGYRILETNYRLRNAEIDIIAKERGVICFVEVKSRSSQAFGPPKEAVSLKKIRKISRAALAYLQQNNFLNDKARFDVVGVAWDGDVAKIELIKNAFDLADGFGY